MDFAAAPARLDAYLERVNPYVFSGLDQTALLWIGIALLVVLAGAWLAISMSSSRDVLRRVPLVLDQAEEEMDDDEDDESGTRAG